MAEHPDYTVWAFGTLPGTSALAKRLGLTAIRQLLRMERGLDAPGGVQIPEGYEVVPYDPADADSIVAVNSAAFSHHPEQGKLTVEEFQQLTQQDWFDPAGLFVAKRGDDVAGFHWTKRHGDGLGEVYVIAVAPGHDGLGLGRVLLQTGLNHLHAMGDDRVSSTSRPIRSAS